MVKYVRSNLLGFLALLVALSGTAYAAIELERSSITAREIAPDAVGASELASGAAGVIQQTKIAEDLRQDQVVLDGGLAQVANSASFTIKKANDRTGIAYVSGIVEITNAPDDKALDAVVNLQILEDGVPEGPAFTVTVPDGVTTSAPVQILCNAMPAGTYVMSIEATEITGLAEGISMNDRVLDIISFGPIFHPP